MVDVKDSEEGCSSLFFQDEDETNTYKKGGPRGIIGELYQAKLLILFLLRGVKHKYKFCLATEMEDAEKFDDIVFKYLHNGEEVYRFLQAKHVADETKRIKVDDLINIGDKNFGLLKYFNSFRKIKANSEFKNTFLKEFTICTNIMFDEKCLPYLEKIHSVDDILNVSGNKGERFKFKESSLETGEIQQFLKTASTSPLNRLATELVNTLLYDACFENKVADCEKYSEFLARNVIDIESKTLYSTFLASTDSDETQSTKCFRGTFKIELIKEITSEKYLKRGLCLKLKPDENILHQIQISHKTLKLSKHFIKVCREILKSEPKAPPDNADIVSEEEIKEFLNKLVFAVDQANEKELGKVIEKEISREFLLNNSAETLYNKLFVQTIDWMKSIKGQFITHYHAVNFFKNSLRGLSIWFDVGKPSACFTGRKNELDELHSLLQSDRELIPCVTGLGGVGKSELIRKYIQQHSEDYDHNVIWIQAESRKSIELSFIRLAADFLNLPVQDNNGNTKDISFIVEKVYRHFSNQKCLFVFDNAVKYKATVDEGIDVYFPSLPKDAVTPYLIVTSRNREWSESKFKTILLGGFSKEDAKQFVKASLNTDEKEDDINKLSFMLQYFPLTLHQSVAYIREVNKEQKCIDPLAKFTILHYLKDFEERTKELLNFEFPDDYDNSYSKTTYTTWNITMEKIEKIENLGSFAAELLYIMSYFAPENIPSKLFLNNSKNDRRLLGSIINILKKYCMIDLQLGNINIHRLVQLVNRIALAENLEERDIIIKCVETLTDEFPLDDSTDDCCEKRKLLPHLESALVFVEQLSNSGKRTVEERHFECLLKCLGNSYGNLGFILKEKNTFERLLNFSEDRHGDKDPRTAEALASLGTAWGDLGDFTKQQELMEKAIDIYDSVDFIGKPRLIVTYGYKMADAFIKLGISYRRLGKLRDAKIVTEKALFIQEKFFGHDNYHYAHVVQKLALIYGSMGDNRTELKMLEESLPLLRKHYGEDHFLIGAHYGMLGAAQSDLGNQREALKYLKVSLEILENYYGSDHYQVGQTLGDMGIAYSALGDYNAAKEKLERWLNIFESHFGEDSTELEAPLTNLALVLGFLNIRDRQLALLNRVLNIRKNSYGLHDHRVALTEIAIQTARAGTQAFGLLPNGLPIFKRMI